MSDSYVTSKATLKCSFGDKTSKLTVYPDRTVFLNGKPMANISDYISLCNINPFGKCHTTNFPATGAATAANKGKLTPMPCIPGTISEWLNGKNDYIIKGKPALLKSSYCRCKWGGIITIINDGQQGEGTQWIQKMPKNNIDKIPYNFTINAKKQLNIHSIINSEQKKLLDNNSLESELSLNNEFSNIVGGKIVKKQDFNCIIQKIECHYTSDKKENKITLFDRSSLLNDIVLERDIQDKDLYNEGILYGRISNIKEYEYYFITNHKGKEIELFCQKEVNYCTDFEHNQYIIDYIDINSKSIKTEYRNLEEGKLKLYYYNLFHRSLEYARMTTTIGAPALGAIIGNSFDFICALRFIHLPYIKPNDNNYESHVLLTYKECPHIPHIPSIVINNYPDIEFNLKIGFCGSKYEYYADNTENNTIKKNPFSLELRAKYASIEKLINFENIDKENLDSDTQKGTIFYQSINSLGNFLKSTAQFTQELKDTINNVYKNNNIDLTNDIDAVGKIYKNTSTSLESTSKWLKGDLNIKPSLIGKWHYSVSNDLSILGRFIEIGIGAECKGELTIDLIQVYITFLKKAKKTTTVAAVTTTVASGGIAGVPSLLIKFLVDVVVDWLMKKFKEGVKFELIFSGNIDLESLSLKWDTSREKIFDASGLTLEIKPEIKLIAALEYKTTISLILSTKAEGEILAKASASASASAYLTWKMKLDVVDGSLGISQDVSINPFTIKLEYIIIGGFEIFGNSIKGGNSQVKEWKSKEYKISPMRLEWFKLNNIQKEDV